MSRRIRCILNGVERSIQVEDHTLLLDAVRGLGLIGAKPSCELEVCGACTVLLDGLPVSACTTLAVEAEGRELRTVEGLAEGNRLSAVQQAFLEHFAFQCGYCTPGMILTAEALLDQHPHPTEEQILQWMNGNICRCTGYRSIVEAVLAAAEKRQRRR